MKKILALVIVIVILSSGCIGAVEKAVEQAAEQAEGNVNNLPTEAGTSEKSILVADSKQLDVAHVYSGATVLAEDNVTTFEERALSYIGAFAMLVINDDSSLDFADVMANSGIGSNAVYQKKIGLYNGFGARAIIEAADNLGYDIHLGLLENGLARSRRLEYDMENTSKAVKYFKDSDEALSQLKLVISSGKPVEIHADAYYLENTLAEQSTFWKENKQDAHFGHFLVVYGYDADNIYLKDPNDPKEASLKAPLSEFLEAWKHGARSGMTGAHLGPYWMISISSNGNRKSASEVIAWNKQISLKAVNAIRSTKSIGDFSDLGVGRREFAKYLRRNTYDISADLYSDSSEMYLSNPDKLILQRIAGYEQVARAKLI